ncbi:MAG: Ig-like domain-containing protein, partial [Candidatus Buchananbacteria bacterium]
MTLKRLLSMQRSLIKFNAVLLLGLIIVAVFIFILPDTSFAQTVTQSSQNINQFVDSAGLKTEASLATIIGRIVQIFLAILGVLLILFIIYGGWIWMSSQGDPGKVEKARKIIINAIIGVIVISLAFAIATFVMGFLNGTFGRGGSGGPTIPGGPDDWNRSMIGRGPIESVYPTPNQRGVSIDTQVVVTFKMAMDASTIYNTSTKIITNNIEICEADSVNYNCLNTATSTFKIS